MDTTRTARQGGRTSSREVPHAQARPAVTAAAATSASPSSPPSSPRPLAGAAAAAAAATRPAPPSAAGPPPRIPTAIGKGGAVSTVDPEASAAGLKVLKPAATPSTPPWPPPRRSASPSPTAPASAVAATSSTTTRSPARSARSTAARPRPRKMPQDAFIDPATGKPYNFTPELVTSGVSVGTPGTLATWDKALANWGTRSLADALAPATKVATRGFVVDETFRQQTLDNEEPLPRVQGHPKLFLPKGDAPRSARLPQPRARRDLRRASRQQRHRRVLPRPAGPADVRRRAQPAHDEEHRAARAARLPDPARPARLQGPLAARDQDHLPRPRRLRHGALVVRWHHRRRGAQHPRALRPLRDDAPSRRCTTTSRPARWRSPTAASTSATRPSSTCRQAAARRQVRRRARLLAQPGQGRDQAGRRR